MRFTISPVPKPSPASSTIRARSTKPARIDDARVHDSNTSRSAGGTSTPTVNAITNYPTNTTEGQGTSFTRH